MAIWFNDLARAKEEAYFRKENQRLIEALRAKELEGVSAPQAEDLRSQVGSKQPDKSAAKE